MKGSARTFKAVLERSAAGAGLVATAPLLVAIAVAIRCTMGRPVLFSQVRPGLRERPFRLYKFRTMREQRPEHGTATSDGARLTRLGRLLRGTSLDELPQLWNVLRGDMSLVGPRPLLMEYLPLYTAEQTRRHHVRPGVTGWAQVNGRNAISWEEKFALDLWYVDHWSLGLDLKILGLTLKRVLGREGVSKEGHATTTPFTGSPTRAAR